MNVYKELENLQKIINMSPGNLYWKDKEGRYLGCNQNQLKVAGFSQLNEILGKTDYDLYSKAIADKVRKIDNHVMQFGKEMIFEEEGVDGNGNHAVYLTRKIPLYAQKDLGSNEKNEIVGIVGVSLDVTEQKHTEQELQETRHKLEAMTLVAASIAHEVRTPLASITLGIESIKKAFWNLASTYELAEKENLSIEHPFRKNDFKLYETIFNSIHNQSNAADTFINMLLMNLNPPESSNAQEVFSIVECVRQALERYPLSKDQKKLIHFDSSNDFQVIGSKLLVIHVLFNLIKNALFYLDKANKSLEETSIQIWLEQDKTHNKLYFKDTGTGIAPDILPHVFDRFFSKTYYGAGIGLTFCKSVMSALGGEITCESIENEYTLFTLVFPNEEMHNK